MKRIIRFLAGGGILLLAACDQQAGTGGANTATPAMAEPPRAANEADGVAAATVTEQPAVPAEFAEQQFEEELLNNTRLLVTGSKRSGEGYFSADGSRFIYQSEQVEGNPFYQIYLMDLASGQPTLVSTGVGLTTCSWVHPTLDRIMFSSTHGDPNAVLKQAEELAFRDSGEEREYGWDYDRHYDIYQADAGGGNLVNLTNTDGYDAEGSYSADGGKILFASNREAYSRTLSRAEQKLFDDDPSYFMDLYIMDADGSNVRQLTFSPGYDGGPFFSPDSSQIVWRRFNPDGMSAEIWTMDVDGGNPRQLTANGMVNWGPYFHPSGDYIIYSSNILGHVNFELFMIDSNGAGPPVRVTNTEGTDILPVFSPDGTKLAWSTTRTPDGSSQIHIAGWNDLRARELLGIK